MGKAPVSVAIMAKNEEKNIIECLSTVDWADEIVILDGYSNDKTEELAKRFAAKVHKRNMDIEGRHRNYLYSLCSNEWVLSLDADERVTPELKDEIISKLEEERKNPVHNAYSIPIRSYVGNLWARYAGWYPAPKVRLFRKGHFRYDETEVHPRVFLDGSSGFLKGDIIHYAYDSIGDLFRNVNEQTTLEAKKWFREGKKFSYFTMFRTTIDRFMRRYFFKRGIKGGFLGFILSVVDSMYQFEAHSKLWELYNRKKTEGNAKII